MNDHELLDTLGRAHDEVQKAIEELKGKAKYEMTAHARLGQIAAELEMLRMNLVEGGWPGRAVTSDPPSGEG